MSEILLSAIVNGAILSLAMILVLSVVFRIFGNQFCNASTRYAVWFALLVLTVFLPLTYAPIGFFQSLDGKSEDGLSPDGAGLPQLPGLPEFSDGQDRGGAAQKSADLNKSTEGNFSMVTVPVALSATRMAV